MNNNFNSQNGEEYIPKKYKKIDLVIFILCILIAFTIWDYSINLDDPIIKKELTVKFVLVNNTDDEYISVPSEGGENQDIPSKKILVYGAKSKLSDVDDITVKINRLRFVEYDKDTNITLNYPNYISSATKQVVLQLHSEFLGNDK